MDCKHLENSYHGVSYCKWIGKILTEDFNCSKCVNKWKAILAIDFDGTIVENQYPEIGSLLEEAKKYINQLYEDGYYIIIWTCRNGEYADQAKELLEKSAIKYHGFNENCPENIALYGTDTRKICAHYYIDDKNIFAEIFWKEIYTKIKNDEVKRCLSI